MLEDVVDRDEGGGTVGTAGLGHDVAVADGQAGDKEENDEGGGTGGGSLRMCKCENV